MTARTEDRGSLRYFFIHIQKAAGTELRELLKRQFPPHALYPNPTDGELLADWPQLSVGQLLARWSVRRSEIRMITGHFPFATTELLGADFVTLSVLREPVERVLSQLRHSRRMKPEERDLSLEEMYERSTPLTIPRNHMATMFALSADEVAATAAKGTWALLMRVELDRARFALAKERLERVDALGLQERFDDFRAEVEARFGWELGAPLHANSTVPSPVSSALRARIAADNAVDIELYAFAHELLNRRARPR